jgi:hypothetical protein
MTMEIQGMACDRHNNMAGLNWLMGYKYIWIPKVSKFKES